ncbi:MAG: ADOP family duplicated permease [Vicinamibacterales bacterium]
MRRLAIRLESLFSRASRERELDAELQYHLDMLIEQNARKGMSRAEARREALRVFGTVEGVKDGVRDNWLSRFVEVAAQDVRYGARSLKRNPGFTLLIIVTMALGIGANSAIFSVVNGVLLRPLPYRNPDKLVVLHQGQGDARANDMGFSVKDIADYRRSRSFSDVVEFHNMFFNLLGGTEPQRVSTGVVSANYFDVLGVKPLYGRAFTAQDDVLGAPAVLVLSNKYWRRSFAADPNVIGRVFRMNDKPHTVVGVLPDVPQYPFDVDVYMPTSACPFRSSATMLERRDHRMMIAFARVRPDVTLDKSRADFQITASTLAKTYPDAYPARDFRAVETRLKDDLTENFTTTLWLLLGTAGFVLLIVCASIANLLLARMVKRDRELSVRAALGATRGRLVRQLLTESLLLAVGGGTLGLGLASISMNLLVAFADRFTPRASEVSMDGHVLLFTLALSVLTGVVFGSIPAFARRLSIAPSLQGEARVTQQSRRMRGALIVAQVSVSFVLLVAAGLALKSLLIVQGTDPGIHVDNLISLRADMSFDRFALDDPHRDEKISAYWMEFERRLRALPGVLDVGGGGTFPLNEAPTFTSGVIRENHPLPHGVIAPQVSLRLASPDYFQTISQPVLAGRAFTVSDTHDSVPVAIINASLAQHMWPDENPIGTRVHGDGDSTLLTIVGVVADVRQQLDHTPADEVYVPLQQQGLSQTTWVVHTRLPFPEAVRDIRAAAHAHDSDLPVSDFRTLDEVRSASLEPRRVVVSLIGMFAALALVITAAGIAGVIAFSVNQRTQEFGIRMALGAPRERILALVVGEALSLVGVGLALGLAGAAVLVKTMGAVISNPQASNGLTLTLLVDVKATDTLTYAAVIGLLALVALAACAVPARRAATVDPNIALRAL